MRMALLLKELRECSLYAGLALLAQIHFLGEGMDLPLIPVLMSGRGLEIPLLNVNRETMFAGTAILAAIVIGLHQTMWESWRQTTLLLLHRPMDRSQIFLGKMLAGSLLVFGTSALPLLVYCLWAAMPGTHSSPFYWNMTLPWWKDVAIALVCYLGAFLTGLRTAAWFGSRTWPLITAIVVSLAWKFAPVWLLFNVAGFAGLMACLTVLILDTAERREFP